MLLYNEDILDILDQYYDMLDGKVPKCNSSRAYDMHPHDVAMFLNIDLMEPVEYNYANQH